MFIFSRKKIIVSALWVIGVLFSITAIYAYWQYSSLYPTTNDAYVNANIVRVAAQVSGPVANVYVQNYQTVKKGQLLFTIDPRPYAIAVAKATANLELVKQQIAANQAEAQAAGAEVADATANFQVAKKNVPRTLTLVKQGKLSQAEGVIAQGKLDSAKAKLNAAQNQLQAALAKLGVPGANNADLQQAQASLDEAKLNLDYTKIQAPADGMLVNFNIRPGTMITIGHPLFALIEQGKWWVDANYKETDLKRIHAGQKATITLDLYPDHKFHGVVTHISRGSGAAFALLPPEDATGNWVKVTQRFPVKILIVNPNPNYPLRVGASSHVRIDTKT